MTSCVNIDPNGHLVAESRPKVVARDYNIRSTTDGIKILCFGYLLLILRNMLKGGKISNVTIVILFALLHSAVAVVTRMLDYYDDIPLTVLTIAMVIVISIRNNIRAEMMAILTLAATAFGFVVGSWLWKPISALPINSILPPAISTLVISTISGFAIDYYTRTTRRFKTNNNAWRPSITNVTLVALSILILRIGYFALAQANVLSEGELLSNTLNIVENSWSILLLIVGNILLTIYVPRLLRRWNIGNHIIVLFAISTIILPPTCSAIIGLDTPNFGVGDEDGINFLATLLAAELVNIFVVTLTILIRLSTSTHNELREERELKRRSEYQYERLKQQINPHFLFNSLGILDYLVQEHETERASSFIRKLANMYRYMLKNDTKPLVKLSDEMEFTRMYIDLLKERFSEGMIVEIDIDKQSYDKYVVPCSVQLLVENATKHNIVSAEQPLTISIATKGDTLVVRNRLQLRRHGQPSTRLGLENIRRQYQDITCLDISVEKTDSEFIVKLPIV